MRRPWSMSIPSIPSKKYYGEEIKQAFYTLGRCQLCKGGSILLFPEGKHIGPFLMPCLICEERSVVATSYLVMAN